MSMIARRATVIRKKRIKKPALSPARTPTTPRPLIREESESTVFENTKPGETLTVSLSHNDAFDFASHNSCDDLARKSSLTRECSARVGEGLKICASPAGTVYINYHATGVDPLPLKRVAIQNGNDARNYFTYDAHEYAKSIDHDDVQHGGSAIALQIREINKEANTSCEFIYKAISILCNSISATVCVGVFLAIPVAMVSVGVKYLNECPKQPKIPIYLLVGGCVGLLFLLVVIWRQIQHRRFEAFDGFDDVPGPESGMDTKSSRGTDVILALFHIAWLIMGTYWVFGIWKPHFSQLLHDPNNWCDKTMYMFAVFQILLCYSLFSLALVVAMGFCICYQITVIFDTSVR